MGYLGTIQWLLKMILFITLEILMQLEIHLVLISYIDEMEKT